MEKLAPADRAAVGPFDLSEVGVLTPYLDFGSIRLSPRQDMAIRADVDDQSKRVVALTVEINKHRMQLQAFAASKSEGLWQQTITALKEGIASQGGSATITEGAIGPELHAEVPIMVGDKKQLRDSIFIGCDGPKWFLRGVISGPDMNEDNYQALLSVFRATVVNRGESPMPPGDLLPLRLPTGDNVQ